MTPIRNLAARAVQSPAQVGGPTLAPGAAKTIRAEIARIQNTLMVARMTPDAYQRMTGQLDFLKSLFVNNNPKNVLRPTAGSKIVAETAKTQHMMTVAFMDQPAYQFNLKKIEFLQSLVMHRG